MIISLFYILDSSFPINPHLETNKEKIISVYSVTSFTLKSSALANAHHYSKKPKGFHSELASTPNRLKM